MANPPIAATQCKLSRAVVLGFGLEAVWPQLFVSVSPSADQSVRSLVLAAKLADISNQMTTGQILNEMQTSGLAGAAVRQQSVIPLNVVFGSWIVDGVGRNRESE